MDPRELLPPECWLLVFDNVEHPQDWLNLSRTSSHLQELIEGKRTTALFSQVLPCVMDYLGIRSLGEILELRLVCRPWKAAVDKMLEKSGNVLCGRQRRQLEDAYNLRDSARMFSFLLQFASHSGNPFVGRVASLKFDGNMSSEDFEEYCLLASQLLARFGTQLKGLRVRILRTSFANCVIRLVGGVLQHTPSLESLSVYCSGCFNNGDVELLQYIELEPLPVLLNLKSISFSGISESGVLLTLQNTLIRLSCNPTSLKSVRTVGFPSELQACPNLNSVMVYLDAAEDYSNLNLVSSAPPWPSLSKLTVCHNFDRSIRPVYECIERFKATLTSLRLINLLSLTHERDLKLKLDLPRLRHLTIKSQESSLELLTNLSNLEVLSMHHYPDLDVIRNTGGELQRIINVIQARVARWRLWDTLPKLAHIWLIGVERRDWERNGANITKMRHVATRSNREFQRI